MLKQRILTGLALLPVAVGGVFFLPLQWFAVFVGSHYHDWCLGMGQPVRFFFPVAAHCPMPLVTGGMIFLFFGLPASFLLGVGLAWWLMALMLVVSYPDSNAAWRMRFVRLLMGWLVLMPAWAGLVYLKSQDIGNELILYVFVLVWGADVGAYFAGRAFGHRKLAPHLSPW